MAPSTRYQKALRRNLAELQKALLIRTTLLGMERHRVTTKTFTRVVREALHNDYMAHAIKVLEQSSQAASFWYLYRTNPGPIDLYARQVGYPLAQLQAVTDKLKKIRNGTHFHIDKVGVTDPKNIWSGAGLTGKELADAIDFVWGALGAIQSASGGEIPSLLEYTPEMAQRALECIEQNQLK